MIVNRIGIPIVWVELKNISPDIVGMCHVTTLHSILCTRPVPGQVHEEFTATTEVRALS